MNELIINNNIVNDGFYKPSEIIHIFKNILASQNTNAKLIFLKGIYIKNTAANNQWAYTYDSLRDEETQQEITIRVTPEQSAKLKSGNLIKVGGIISRQITAKGYIQLILFVSRLDIVQEQVMSGAEMKMVELRKLKSQKGFKNVDSLLEEKLFTGGKPSIALLFASTSITMADFEAGKKAASAHVDFKEHRVPFSNAKELSDTLKKLDFLRYDAIALIRGGGNGIESLDDLLVIETAANLQTPLICAVGHVNEKLFLKYIADKTVPTPNGLGTYFSEMVENVIQKKNKSKAILVEQVRKQFIDQIILAEKQNKELQEKFTLISKNTEANQKQHKEQTEALQKQLFSMQEELKSLKETNDKQAKDFNTNLSAMQQTNNALQKSLDKLTSQNTKAEKDLAEAKAHAALLEQQLADSRKGCLRGCFGMIVTFVSILGLACWLFVSILCHS